MLYQFINAALNSYDAVTEPEVAVTTWRIFFPFFTFFDTYPIPPLDDATCFVKQKQNKIVSPFFVNMTFKYTVTALWPKIFVEYVLLICSINRFVHFVRVLCLSFVLNTWHLLSWAFLLMAHVISHHPDNLLSYRPFDEGIKLMMSYKGMLIYFSTPKTHAIKDLIPNVSQRCCLTSLTNWVSTVWSSLH